MDACCFMMCPKILVHYRLFLNPLNSSLKIFPKSCRNDSDLNLLSSKLFSRDCRWLCIKLSASRLNSFFQDSILFSLSFSSNTTFWIFSYWFIYFLNWTLTLLASALLVEVYWPKFLLHQNSYCTLAYMHHNFKIFLNLLASISIKFSLQSIIKELKLKENW